MADEPAPPLGPVVGGAASQTLPNETVLYLMPKTWHQGLLRYAPDYKLVLQSVNDVLAANYITDPPIPISEIAATYGYGVTFASFSEADRDVSGFYDLATHEIFVNAAEHPRRQAFTIAHELGHALLHGRLFARHPEEYQVLLRAPIGAQRDPLEQEANSFAANLLVPKAMLDRYQRLADNAELGRLFNVSEEVIRYRIAYESRYA